MKPEKFVLPKHDAILQKKKIKIHACYGAFLAVVPQSMVRHW
jgi:hypothetical protein